MRAGQPSGPVAADDCVSTRTQPLAEAERNARVFAGEILCFRGFDATRALVERLRERCREFLGDDPERAHRRLAAPALDAASTALRKAIDADAEVAARLGHTFRAIGVAVDATFSDGLKQRVQPPRRMQGQTQALAALAAHRDTWGSNIAAQTNWWAPVFPITAGRTLAVFPGWFERAVANDSGHWDFAALIADRARAQSRYPLLPLAIDPPPAADAVPMRLEPGYLLCFSGAHLHASVPNDSDRTRLSFELRTVNGADVAAGRGAPNVDGAAPRITWQLFRSLTDRRRLGSMQARR